MLCNGKSRGAWRRVILAMVLGGIAAAALPAVGDEIPLAIVDGDTISTADLREEIAIMGNSSRTSRARSSCPRPRTPCTA